MGRTILKVGGTLMTALITAVLNANDVEEAISPFGFSIQWSLLTFLLFLGFVAWWIGGLEFYKSRWEKSKPNFIVNKIGDWQFYRTDAIYGALQIWFQNKPKVSSDTSIAEKVTAKVKFYGLGTKETQENSGCFIKAESMDWAGNIERLEVIDTWPPNDEPRKLQVALRWKKEDMAYRFVYKTPEDGRMERMEILKGTYFLRVSFSGVRVVQQSLWFKLVNPGQGENNPFLTATHIKKPNLRKEGFQSE